MMIAWWTLVWTKDMVTTNTVMMRMITTNTPLRQFLVKLVNHKQDKKRNKDHQGMGAMKVTKILQMAKFIELRLLENNRRAKENRGIKYRLILMNL
jgi:hypothetical protein